VRNLPVDVIATVGPQLDRPNSGRKPEQWVACRFASIKAHFCRPCLLQSDPGAPHAGAGADRNRAMSRRISLADDEAQARLSCKYDADLPAIMIAELLQPADSYRTASSTKSVWSPCRRTRS
jgi:hypothetical protein